MLQRHERQHRGSTQSSVKEGNLVLLSYPHSARYDWPLARVEEIYPDERGVVRSVKVRCRGEEYLHPISQIVPLELDGEQEWEVQEVQQIEEDEERLQESTADEPQMLTPEPGPRYSSGPVDVSLLYSGRTADVSVGDESPHLSQTITRSMRKAAKSQRQQMRELMENKAI